MFFRKGRR
ncbi:acyltransferase family protein, partial [Chlamydia psittaci 06-1683]